MNSLSPTRRRWLRQSAIGCGAVATFGLNDLIELLAAESDKPALAPLNGFPRMVQEYYVSQVREIARPGKERRRKMTTTPDARAYVEDVRQKIQACFGPWPERTPLNPRVTGVVERDAYRIEKVIFESRPEFYVTANLYVPKGMKSPAPGVVGSCGHSPNGKSLPVYQSFAQGLARQGYVCLIFDPIGQGERSQFVDGEFKATIAPGTSQHITLGNQQFVVGEFFGSWRAWDGMRALDYLLSREEVDPQHVGITGNSGGGTMTTWLCGVDQRWTMAAPSCFVTTFRRNLENELPADTEQCPPRALALGLDHSDFLAALAPKPIIILAQEQDFFDVRGALESLQRLKQLYFYLGNPKDVSIHVGPGGHGYSQDSREAMYAWFNRASGRDGPSAEPTLTIEEDETLWCTKRGQVAELDSRTVYSFTRDKAAELTAARDAQSDQALRTGIRDVLKLPARESSIDYRILRPRRGRGYPSPHAAVYSLETDPGIEAIVYRLQDAALYSRPPQQAPQQDSPAILYVAHDSSDAELRDEPLVRELIAAEPGATLYTCDVRGLGESKPNTCGENSYASHYGCDFFYASHAIMLDRPYVGGRTHDVLCVLDWLRHIGHYPIHLVGNGYGSIPAALAAMLLVGGAVIRRVTLKHALTSYADIASAERSRWPLSSMIPGVLAKFDLPDVYRELKSKRLRLIEPWNAEMHPAG
jgi:dienelactone hydrolase/pimeloyl-ACP methyl ester carboxylesterase